MMRTWLGILWACWLSGTFAPACSSSGGGGGGDVDVDVDADADGDGASLRDYCEYFVGCVQPGDVTEEAIGGCMDSNRDVSQLCIDCRLAQPCEGIINTCRVECGS